METIFAAVVGAVFGALATHIVSAYLQQKKERKEARRNLVGVLSSFTYEYLAALMELYSARIFDSDKAMKEAAQLRLAEITRLEGKAMELEVRFWRYFSEREVRAAFHKLLIRFDKVKELLTEGSLRSPSDVGNALDWVQHQMADTVGYASKAAGVTVVDKARIMFVGLRPVTEEDNRKLSFEDEPPPWLTRTE
jgi:hypothetical protein